MIQELQSVFYFSNIIDDIEELLSIFMIKLHL
jgi:hypothetical protein